jgi:hypothetical protein
MARHVHSGSLPEGWQDLTDLIDSNQFAATKIGQHIERGIPIPEVDFRVPDLKDWLRIRAKKPDEGDLDFEPSKSANSQNHWKESLEAEIRAEVDSALAVRFRRLLPPIGSGWQDVALLALETVTHAILLWRFAFLHDRCSLLRRPARFIIWEVKVGNDRTTEVSKESLVLAEFEDCRIISMPLWALDAHAIPPPLKEDWMRGSVPFVMRCVNDFLADVIIDNLPGEPTNTISTAPACVISAARSSCMPEQAGRQFLQTGRGGQSGGISPGRLVNRLSRYVREEIDRISYLPYERTPDRPVFFVNQNRTG